jgi:peptidoglycan/xylan/chitin deacetylase (PgdA/CDA1 family)
VSWKTIAREGSARALRWSAAPYLIRRAYSRGSATVLLYHDPSPDVLQAHLEYLASRYRFTTLDAVVDAITRADWSRLPDDALVLTFDDGHRGNHALLPLFRRFQIRPTIFLCSQIVGTTRGFWFNEPTTTSSLKHIANGERLALLERTTGFVQEHERGEPARQALSRDEILEMAPFVDFGSHTRFHPILPRCADEEAWREIAESKRELEALLGRSVSHFAYPNGDYGPREMEFVRRAGFRSARTTELGWAQPTSELFRLGTFGVTDDASVDMMTVQISGVSGYLRRLARSPLAARSGRSPSPTP